MERPVLITGCSSGIGLVTTQYLAQRVVPVYATVRTEDDAARLNAIEGVDAFTCDVTSDQDVRALRAAIDERGNGLWGLIHNVGIANIGRLTATSVEDLRTVLEVNVVGVHRVTNALTDLLIASGGRIVTMSSMSGTVCSVRLGPYSMSKHALEAYTDTLANELAPSGVRVCAIVPGNFSSGIMSNAVQRFDPPKGDDEEVAALWKPDADTSRSRFPGPEPVAEACFHALFDEKPLSRYLVVPIPEEADRVLEQAAHEWDRLNRSTPYAWTLGRLWSEIEGSGE